MLPKKKIGPTPEDLSVSGFAPRVRFLLELEKVVG
jgi:hypothetical protein